MQNEKDYPLSGSCILYIVIVATLLSLFFLVVDLYFTTKKPETIYYNQQLACPEDLAAKPVKELEISKVTEVQVIDPNECEMRIAKLEEYNQYCWIEKKMWKVREAEYIEDQTKMENDLNIKNVIINNLRKSN